MNDMSVRPPAIRFEHASKDFARADTGETFRAVDDLDLEIGKGELVAMRGLGGSAFRPLRPAPRCQTAYLGPGSLAVALPLPVGDDVRAKVTVKLAARSNPGRRTLVEQSVPTLR